MILEIVDILGIKIGSRAWDCATEGSDYDYAISEGDWITIRKLLIAKDIIIDSADYATDVVFDKHTSILFNIANVKFDIEDKTINLLVYKNSDIHLPMKLNEEFDLIKANKPELWKLIQTDKQIRIAMVRQALMNAYAFDTKLFEKIELDEEVTIDMTAVIDKFIVDNKHLTITTLIEEVLELFKVELAREEVAAIINR